MLRPSAAGRSSDRRSRGLGARSHPKLVGGLPVRRVEHGREKRNLVLRDLDQIRLDDPLVSGRANLVLRGLGARRDNRPIDRGVHENLTHMHGDDRLQLRPNIRKTRAWCRGGTTPVRGRPDEDRVLREQGRRGVDVAPTDSIEIALHKGQTVRVDLGSRQLRTFALPRMRKARNTKARFKRPADFSISKHLVDSFGVFATGKARHRVW